jgi:hypothetical protein
VGILQNAEINIRNVSQEKSSKPGTDIHFQCLWQASDFVLYQTSIQIQYIGNDSNRQGRTVFQLVHIYWSKVESHFTKISQISPNQTHLVTDWIGKHQQFATRSNYLHTRTMKCFWPSKYWK